MLNLSPLHTTRDHGPWSRVVFRFFFSDARDRMNHTRWTYLQLRGGQRPGTVSLFTVQHDRRVLRLFRGDTGPTTHVGPWDCGWSHSAGGRRVHAGASGRCRRCRTAVRSSASQRAWLHHVLCHTASDETVHPAQARICATFDTNVALTLVQHVTHSGPEVFFKTCVAMKFVDDDDDDDDDFWCLALCILSISLLLHNFLLAVFVVHLHIIMLWYIIRVVWWWF